MKEKGIADDFDRNFKRLFNAFEEEGYLVNTEFHPWFFKRKFTITYGEEPKRSFATTVVIPKEEAINPLFPTDDCFENIFRMLLSAFSKNNIVSVESELLTRSFSYEKNDAGRISLETGTKLVTYYY